MTMDRAMDTYQELQGRLYGERPGAERAADWIASLNDGLGELGLRIIHGRHPQTDAACLVLINTDGDEVDPTAVDDVSQNTPSDTPSRAPNPDE